MERRRQHQRRHQQT